MERGIALWGYAVVSIIHLLGILIGYDFIVPYSKVLLMPTLCIYYFYNTQDSTWKYSVYIALFCAWLGDIFLIFSGVASYYFLLGLGSFLLAHLHYIYTFIKVGLSPKRNNFNITLSLLALLYLAFMLRVLLPTIPTDFIIPVSVYAIILICLLIAALFVYQKTAQVGKYLILGCVLFILSDSLIAFGKFLPDTIAFLPNLSFCIMLTYIIAQWLIIKSLFQHKVSNND